MRNLVISLSGIAMLGIATATVAGGNGMPKPVVDVHMQCNTMVAAFEVDAGAARAALPGRYQLALQPSGNALVYLQTSTCDGTGNGRPMGTFGLADAWLLIERPADYPPYYEEIDGAVVTLPTLYVYVLKAQTTSKWVKTRCAKIHFPKELIRSLDVGGPIAPLRSGHVEEMTGRGYLWTEFAPCMAPPGSPWGECWMFPDPAPKVPVGFGLDPFPIGYNIRGWVQRGDGSRAMKAMSCVKAEAGQGLISLELDPKSNLAKLGIFQNGQVGYFSDSAATCHLVMSQD